MKEVVEKIDTYLEQKDWRVRENANTGYSFQGLVNRMAEWCIAQYWLERVYPSDIAKAHVDGDFHIHDIGYLTPYCVGWDIVDLLMSGFKGVVGKVESAPPKHFRTALGQIANFLFTMQGEAAGAQSLAQIAVYLAPFIRYDGLDYKQVKQAIQEFVYYLAIPTRVGFQTPFTNITMDLKVPEYLADEPAICSGMPTNDVLGDFEEEVKIFNQAFCEVMYEGDGRSRPFTFPIPTYNVTKEWKDEWEFEPLWKMTAKYGIPYFANFVNSDMKPEDIRSMCCRLRLDTSELRKRVGGLFAAGSLTGSVGVVTINMPRLGLLTKGDDDAFFERLVLLMDMAAESLHIKREFVEKMTEKGLYPYSKFYLRNVKAMHGRYWANHFSTIGLNGMHEALLFFGIEEGIVNEEGRKFAKKVLLFMREKLKEYQEKYGELFNLEATPAEGVSYRFARLDREKFGIDREYYTNSTQLPVHCTDDLWFAIQHQNDLQPLYTGGTVLHIFTGEANAPWQMVSKLIKKVCEISAIPYYSLTPTYSICPNCGYRPSEVWKCPTCGSTCEVYSRIVGYLRPVQTWNDGKKAEFKERKLFPVNNT